MVCERMADYGELTDSSTNRKSYVRIKSRSGEPMDLSEAALDSRVTGSLKFSVSTKFHRIINKCTTICFNGITVLLLVMIIIFFMQPTPKN